MHRAKLQRGHRGRRSAARGRCPRACGKRPAHHPRDHYLEMLYVRGTGGGRLPTQIRRPPGPMGDPLMGDRLVGGHGRSLVPSLLSMFAAVYVLYLCAREFMDRESSLIACVLFSLHPIVTFAAADARPYAVSVLVTNCAILFLLRWLRTDSTRYAVAFGTSCGLIIYFHYLFGPILIAFALLMLSFKWREWRSFV